MKSLEKKVRALHRDLGYFVIGITLIYAITGIILSGRGLGWLKKEFVSISVIETNIKKDEFEDTFKKLIYKGEFEEVFPKDSYKMVKKHLNLKLVKQENQMFHYKAWRTLKVQYNSLDGNIDVRYVGYPAFIELFIDAHKAAHNKAWFYLAIIYSVILSFLALSSIVMVKGKKGFKRRGVYFMLAGFAVVALFLYI